MRERIKRLVQLLMDNIQITMNFLYLGWDTYELMMHMKFLMHMSALLLILLILNYLSHPLKHFALS